MKRRLGLLIAVMMMGTLIVGSLQAQEETPETPLPEATEEMTDDMNMDMTEEADMSMDDDMTADETVSLDAITDDPEVYYGQMITVEDEIVEALAPRIFVMERSQLLQSDRLLVVYNTDSIEGFDIVQIANNDLTARVTGTLEQFIVRDIHELYTPDLDFSLFEETFADYEGNAVLIADTVTITDEVDREDIDEPDIHDVLDNPTALMEQELTLEEQLVEFIAPNIYRIEDKDFFSPAELMVIYSGDDTIDGIPVQELVEEDPEVTVTGIVRDFDLTGLEQEFGVDFDDDVYGGYEGPIFIASSIVLREEVDTTEMNDGVDDIVPTPTP
ncbi:MAG: hypothetical protein RLP44_10165 [Aggregatilineales bacterium]